MALTAPSAYGPPPTLFDDIYHPSTQLSPGMTLDSYAPAGIPAPTDTYPLPSGVLTAETSSVPGLGVPASVTTEGGVPTTVPAGSYASGDSTCTTDTYASTPTAPGSLTIETIALTAPTPTGMTGGMTSLASGTATPMPTPGTSSMSMVTAPSPTPSMTSAASATAPGVASTSAPAAGPNAAAAFEPRWDGLALAWLVVMGVRWVSRWRG